MAPRPLALAVAALCFSAVAGQQTPADQSLSKARSRIDSLDSRIVALLDERARVVLEIGAIKKRANLAVSAPARAEAVLNHAVAASKGPLPADSVRRIYERIVGEMTEMERAHNGASAK